MGGENLRLLQIEEPLIVGALRQNLSVVFIRRNEPSEEPCDPKEDQPDSRWDFGKFAAPGALGASIVAERFSPCHRVVGGESFRRMADDDEVFADWCCGS